MGIVFISIASEEDLKEFLQVVSVPYGDLFYFYDLKEFLQVNDEMVVSVPYGDLFYFY